MTDLKNRILAAVQEDLSSIEDALSGNLNPQLNLVRQVAGHLLFAGGKRLRPLLMMLSARLCGHADRPSAADTSVIFEYLHAATLIHDDVVDGADLRRGRPAAHHVWDPPTAVLTGDFLLARALSLAARTGLPEVIAVIAGITEQMSQGEIRQLAHKGDVALDEEIYMDVIRCKTAVLFQGACRVGALIAGATRQSAQALSEFGFHLGMAFQMADDLLDYTQDTAALGKKAGADLREGKLTLPVIYALRQAGPQDKLWMEALIRAQAFTPSDFDRLLDRLRFYGGIDYTRDLAAGQIRQAKQALFTFDPSPERRILEDVVEYAWSRAS
ncbi:MAG: polyprenyl synthetase family protein [Desulfobacteraceae bacterium]|nr:MAG: polyprenyl synthetase family protein [Desulfobacteraceae bacterium]